VGRGISFGGRTGRAVRRVIAPLGSLPLYRSGGQQASGWLTAIVCDENGLAVFDLIRRHGALASAVLCAFDLLELDGNYLRREPIEKRKALLAKLLRRAHYPQRTF